MRLTKRRAKKAGASPGSLVHVGERKLTDTRITLTRYGPEGLTESGVDVATACATAQEGAVTWINVQGLHDVEALGQLADAHGLHPLVTEDILDTSQRPKMEDYEEHMYIVVRYFWYDEQTEELHDEQLSLILARGMVITFCEGGREMLEPVRDRLRQGNGRLRTRGADYLAYAILDTVVDSYFVAMDMLGQQIEIIETQLMADPDREVLESINRAKRQTAMVRRAAWATREAMSRLEHEDSELLDPNSLIFIRDLYDHTIQIVDTLETFRDILSSMLDTYLSSVSNRMNEVMKVLTIIATIFIPLTFIAGVYGMNFKHMPELGYPWAYPATLGLMLLIVVGMLLYFRRRRWL